jgi:hypothetical protein
MRPDARPVRPAGESLNHESHEWEREKVARVARHPPFGGGILIVANHTESVCLEARETARNIAGQSRLLQIM